MASVFPLSRNTHTMFALPGSRRLARGMSRHAAGAMLLFAGWQAWLAIGLSDQFGAATLPWAALILLILGAIPLTRAMERRWHRLAQEALPCPGLLSAYRRDRARLWLLALAVPPLSMTATLAAAQVIAAV